MLIHEALEFILSKEIESWSVKLENGEVRHYLIKLTGIDSSLELFTRRKGEAELKLPGELLINVRPERLTPLFEKLTDERFKITDKY